MSASGFDMGVAPELMGTTDRQTIATVNRPRFVQADADNDAAAIGLWKPTMTRTAYAKHASNAKATKTCGKVGGCAQASASAPAESAGSAGFSSFSASSLFLGDIVNGRDDRRDIRDHNRRIRRQEDGEQLIKPTAASLAPLLKPLCSIIRPTTIEMSPNSMPVTIADAVVNRRPQEAGQGNRKAFART